MASLIDTMNRFRRIETATAPTDDPAPVYLLDEIAEMARQSPEAAQAIADAVQKKLGVKSPIVKFKALRVIKHLCTKGCSQFQRCMQRHSASVRELIHFRGEPDPFKGDVPNARVREFAKEVVEVMFNATPAAASQNTLAAQGRIQGFGSSGAEASVGSSSSSNTTGAYGGFRSSASTGLPGSFAAAQQAASQLTQAAQQALGEGPIAQGLASAANALGSFLQPAGYGNKLNEGGYKDHHPAGPDYSYSSASSYAAPDVAHVTAGQVLGSEEGLVDDITTPGGLRPLPDPADLRRFVDNASSMDGLRIAELLRGKMESSRWQVVLRALAALEAILRRGSNQACGEVAVMFQSDATPIRSSLQSPQQQVQQLAASVLKLLLGEEVQLSSSAATTTGAAKKAPVAAPVKDLLIDDQPAAATAAAAAAASSSNAAIDLLGDLLDTTAAPAGPSAAAAAAAAGGSSGKPAGMDSLFDGLGVTAAPVAAGGAASSTDLFGGLQLTAPSGTGAATATLPLAATKQQTVPAAAPLDELFSGLTTNATTGNGTASNAQPAMQQPAVQQSAAFLQQHGQGQQQQQQTPVLPDLLGDLASGPAQQQPSFGLFGVQVNGPTQQQQQHGMAAPMPLQQQQQVWSSSLTGTPAMPGKLSATFGAASGHQNNVHMPQHSAGSGSNSAWSGHDDVSNLMRHVSSGGKYDPAFDFVSQEFKK